MNNSDIRCSDMHWRLWAKEQRRKDLEAEILDGLRTVGQVWLTVIVGSLVYFALCVFAA